MEEPNEFNANKHLEEKRRTHYILGELITLCNPEAPPPKDMDAWVEMGTAGDEIV